MKEAKGKKPAPSGHWERHYDTCDPSKAMKRDKGADFVAMPAKKRSMTHNPVNETDY